MTLPPRSLKLQVLCKIVIGTTRCDLKPTVLDDLSLSSSAATGPNPQAGRPRRGPGAPRRDLPMDGTWALIERGVTATSSKCPVFKETEGGWGGLPLSQMFQMLRQPVIIPATSLPPHCLHLCIRNTDSLLPPLLRTLCPCLLSLSLTLLHTHNTPRAASQTQGEGFRECMHTADDEDIHLCRDVVVIWGPRTVLRGCWLVVPEA